MKEEEFENLIHQNSLKKIGNIYLTNYQKEILEKYQIPYQNCQNGKELLFLLSDIVDEEEYDELEEVARQIDEFSYYYETRK